MYSSSISVHISLKAKALLSLSKPRLTLLVVFSSVIGYFMGAEAFNLGAFLWLILGGFLVTASANTFNQIIEQDYDKLMKRTANRPLPTNKVTFIEALSFGTITGAFGLFILFFFINELSGWLGALSLFMYVLLYTPLKRRSPIGVFVGAFPGAIPPMLGWVAATNSFGLVPGLLFLIQFAWQFPHFWAIAWKLNEDYTTAGFKMLPLQEGLTKRNAAIILLYTVFILPTSFLLYYFKVCGFVYLIPTLLMGLYFTYTAYQLYQDLSAKKALQLMKASFMYLPIVQILMVIDKI